MIFSGVQITFPLFRSLNVREIDKSNHLLTFSCNQATNCATEIKNKLPLVPTALPVMSSQTVVCRAS